MFQITCVVSIVLLRVTNLPTMQDNARCVLGCRTPTIHAPLECLLIYVVFTGWQVYTMSVLL